MIAALTLLGVWLAPQVLVYDPANPAQFELLYRQHWETAGTSAAARDYGIFLSRTGDRDGAVRMLRRAHELEESPETLEALAAVVSPREAIALLDRAVTLRPSGDLYRKIGSLLEAGGDRKAAEKRYRAALGAFEKESGPAHPKVAVALNDLGLLLEHAEDFRGAEALYRRALAIQEKAFGAMHPEIGTTLNNLGGAVGAAGRLQQAEPLLRRALKTLEETLGQHHERVAACAGNLAGLLAALGGKAESRSLYGRSAAIYETLGDREAARLAREAAAGVR
jgi:tetratricopeptide (TPR) repeat protein